MMVEDEYRELITLRICGLFAIGIIFLESIVLAQTMDNNMNFEKKLNSPEIAHCQVALLQCNAINETREENYSGK